MIKVKKLFGEYPVDTVVGNKIVHFDEQGEAEVNEEIANKLGTIPGYQVEQEPVEEVVQEEPAEEELPKVKPAPRRPAPKK